MEESERLQEHSDSSSKDSDHAMASEPGDVDHGSISTAPPSKAAGVTDPVVLAENDSPSEDAPEASSPEVPEKVILKDDGTTSAQTEIKSKADGHRPPLSASMSALPDPPNVLKAQEGVAHGRSMGEEAAAVSDSSGQDSLDDYIRSPEVQNAIVERSPGGRYVRFMEKLGSGASKDVYRAYDTQEGIEVAWNVVNLSGVPKNERNRIVNEVRLLERLHHHNIISFHGSWVNRERQEVNFVTEILSSGTLKSFINKVQVIRWKIAKRWALQILKGLEYLHSQDPPVIHRDLKCENVFINGTSGDLRIGDLGLSTVHRNGKVLSVLGTPEFMAPDMYEEQSYDESVDIYAFGMCMLEIFTKEIPYAECKNPAQIYKKVSNGDWPEVLSRLQSRHARDFVIKCLGHRDENGKYVRPSASELLKHPFLVKRANDDDEVVVERPLHQRTIPEHAGESSHSVTTTPTTKRSVSVDASANIRPLQQKLEGALENSSPAPQPRQRGPSNTASDEDDGDRFEEMPESETNMKKVKVLMGRGQELKEEEEPRSEDSALSVDGSVSSADRPDPSANATKNPPPAVQPDRLSQATQQQTVMVEPQDTPTPTPATPPHFLVAAAVIENEGMDSQPYADGVLKLVVTLPVEGQTQNVQFDFHLVEDDPIKVAKEMVNELGIPQAAVLEISETISGLACAARMRQEKMSARGQNPPNLAHQQPQQNVAQPQQVQNQGSVPSSQQEVAQNLSQVSNASPVPEYPVGGGIHTALPQLPQQTGLDQSMQVQGQPVAQQSMFAQPQNAAYGHTQVTPDNPLSSQALHTKVPAQPYAGAPVSSVHPPPQQALQSAQTHGIGQQQQQAAQPAQPIPPQVAIQQVTQPGNSLPSGQSSASQHGVAQTTAIGQQRAQPMPAQSLRSQQQPQPQPQQQQQQQQPRPSQSQVASENQASTSAQLQQSAPSQPQPSAPSARATQNNASGPAKEPLLPQPSKISQRAATTGGSSATYSEHPVKPSLVNGSSASLSLGEETESDEEDPGFHEELRKLDEDFQKNLQRAKKVFDNRMDNLQRSQFEREAQHQKTVEKHHKERAEFDKRLAQEKEQQMRRMEQLQREWDRKRGELAQHKRRNTAPAMPAPGNKPTNRQVSENGSDAGSEPQPPQFAFAPAGAGMTRVMSGSSGSQPIPEQVALQQHQQDTRLQNTQIDSQER